LLYLKYCLATGLLTGLLYLIIRSWKSASLLAVILMAFQFLFGAIHDGLKVILPDSFLVRYTFILPIVFISFTLLLIFFKRKKPVLAAISSYLNLLLLVLIVMDLFVLGFKLSKHDSRGEATSQLTGCDTCAKPDVFLLIADSYSGHVPLKEVLHFDNSAFENALRQRGFSIIDSSRSNYNYTPFTMASMLSMDYLQGLEGHDKSRNDRRICYARIDQNLVVDFFRTQGYAFRNFSIFRFAGQLPPISTSFYRNGEDLIDVHTFLGRLDRDIRYHAVTSLKIRSEEDRHLYHHKNLNEVLYQKTWDEVKKQSEKPRFVYTHIEMPHYPYYFDSAGRPNPREDLVENRKTDIDKYLGFLQYGNTRYLELIDHILSNAKQPPIILFMSDHGFREYGDDSVDLRYHFMNFNSVYLPGKQYQHFYPGMTTVNQFRVLLNAAFGQKLPLLKDSIILIQE
jgi:preprotein translocase subunit SecG